MEYLIRRGRYASCVHAGGLSCSYLNLQLDIPIFARLFVMKTHSNIVQRPLFQLQTIIISARDDLCKLLGIVDNN